MEQWSPGDNIKCWWQNCNIQWVARPVCYGQHPCILPVWRQISITMELGLDFAAIFIVQIQTQLKIDSGLMAQLVLTLLKVAAV